MGSVLDIGDKISSIVSAVLAAVTLGITVSTLRGHNSSEDSQSEEMDEGDTRSNSRPFLIPPVYAWAVLFLSMAPWMSMTSKGYPKSPLAFVTILFSGLVIFALSFFLERFSLRISFAALGIAGSLVPWLWFVGSVATVVVDFDLEGL
jgi:type III secretory pathway component EscV